MSGFSLATGLSLFFSVLSLFVALSAGLPALAKLCINRLYNPPGIEIDIQTHTDDEPVPWYEFDQQEVINRVDDNEVTMPQVFIGAGPDTKDLNMERVEVFTSKDWNLIKFFQRRAQRVGFNRYSVPQEGLTHNGFIASGGGQGIPFPFEPEPEDCEFEVTVYSTVSASEFRIPLFGSLPRYFGDVSLEPVSKSCKISGSD